MSLKINNYNYIIKIKGDLWVVDEKEQRFIHKE